MQPLMPKATAVWLVDNTTLTFDQIADFTDLHRLEISGIADGEVAIGIKGFDPILNNQLTRDEIARCEQDANARLKLRRPAQTAAPKKKAPRYTPVSKRQERPSAIAWLVRRHPELVDKQISKLLGTTKSTIEAIRNKTHWNSSSIQPVDPVALGLCRQIDLDAAVKAAAERRTREAEAAGLTPIEPQGARLVSADEALADAPDARLRGFEGFESLAEPERGEPDAATIFGDDGPTPDDDDQPDDAPLVDADTLFSLPDNSSAE